MIAETRWCLGLPSASLTPVNSSTKFVDRYRRIPNSLAFVTAAIASFVLAVVSGFLGGIAATYLYDRANSKGDDFAVGLGGLFAVGTFTFVIVFTWLQKTHHPVSSSTSLFAFYACLILPVAATVLFAEDMDDYYLFFVLGDWLAILLLGLLSVFVCRRWWQQAN